MSDTQVLWSYPLLALARRVRRVDSRYAYLVVKDGFVPLRRREGVLSVILRYKKYKHNHYETHNPILVDTVLSDYDEVSTFFQTKLEEEYAEEIEKDDYGKLWDKKFDELYGMRKILVDSSEKDAVNRKREKAIAKELNRLYDIENIQLKTALLERRLKSCNPLDKTGYETTQRKLRELKYKRRFSPKKHVDPCSVTVTFDDDDMVKERKKRKVRYLFF